MAVVDVKFKVDIVVKVKVVGDVVVEADVEAVVWFVVEVEG